MLKWNVHMSPVFSLFNRPTRNYALADFKAIHHALMQIDWSCVLQGDANDTWQAFHSLLKSLEDQYRVCTIQEI